MNMAWLGSIHVAGTTTFSKNLLTIQRRGRFRRFRFFETRGDGSVLTISTTLNTRPWWCSSLFWWPECFSACRSLPGGCGTNFQNSADSLISYRVRDRCRWLAVHLMLSEVVTVSWRFIYIQGRKIWAYKASNYAVAKHVSTGRWVTALSLNLTGFWWRTTQTSQTTATNRIEKDDVVVFLFHLQWCVIPFWKYIRKNMAVFTVCLSDLKSTSWPHHLN